MDNRIISCIAFIIVGILLILWGIKGIKKLKEIQHDDPTLIDYRLILSGIMAIILGLLGLFNVIPWEK